ncbi:YSIRK signal domain/LPXTG anchor domain surface protein [Streptococcus didelphis]|uniref:YSIRK signal domain/LPXTG anchor domain surface protein n=1 Tax=Streptococcus didelphis TaxID=102886 RepID=UPI0003661E22|nr:YSIRK signal domain/LPXTG anchor domain surface protein [Streptococcus didelphis]
MKKDTETKKRKYALRKSKFGLVPVVLAIYMILGTYSTVSADQVEASSDLMTSSQIAEDPAANLLTAINRKDEVTEMAKTYQEQGFEVSLEESTLDYSGAHQAPELVAEINKTYDEQKAQLEKEVAAYQAQENEYNTKLAKYQEEQAQYEKDLANKVKIETENATQKKLYEEASKKYEEDIKSLGNDYQFTAEDKKSPENKNTDDLKLYGELDQTKTNSVAFYQQLKVKADLKKLEAHSLKGSLTWNKETVFEKIGDSYQISSGDALKSETNRIHHATKLTGYKENDAFILRNVGEIETGDKLDLKVTITKIGDGYGSKDETEKFKVEQALYVGKEYEKKAEDAGAIEFIYRNHRDMSFKFEFLVANKETKILLTQAIGDIDLGQKISFDFGKDGKKLFSIPEKSKITNVDDKYSSEDSFNVENFNMTPLGTMLAIGVGKEMNYTHITEDSYYNMSNTATGKKLSETEFDKQKSDLINNDKRVAGILFSLFGDSVKLNEVVKPKEPVEKIVTEPKIPIKPEVFSIAKPKLKLKQFVINFKPLVDIPLIIQAIPPKAEELLEPMLPLQPAIPSVTPPPVMQEEMEIIVGSGPVFDIFEDSSTDLVAGSHNQTISTQENRDPIFEESYDTSQVEISEQSFLIELTENSQLELSGFSGDDIEIEDSLVDPIILSGSSDLIEITEDSSLEESGSSGDDIEIEDSLVAPIVTIGSSDLIEITEDSSLEMSGSSGDDVEVEDTLVKKSYHFDNKWPFEEEKEEVKEVQVAKAEKKQTNSTPFIFKSSKNTLPKTGDSRQNIFLATFFLSLALFGLLGKLVNIKK